MSSTPWLAYYKPNPQARLRLFCFPFAGGAASVYRTWSQALPATIEVCPVQLPGREARLSEELARDMAPLVQAIGQGLSSFLDLPYAVFGYSMGARVGFEVARHWRRQGREEPRHFFAAASAAPRIPTKSARHRISDEELTAQIRRLGGTPEAVLQDRSLMEMFLPILRADFTLLETYQYRPEEPLACPVTALLGKGDVEVSPADMYAWQDETCAAFTAHEFPGGHWFLQSQQAQVVQLVAESLAKVRL